MYFHLKKNLFFATQGDISEAQEGDPKYLAPELMDGKFGKAADVFRFVVFFA